MKMMIFSPIKALILMMVKLLAKHSFNPLPALRDQASPEVIADYFESCHHSFSSKQV